MAETLYKRKKKAQDTTDPLLLKEMYYTERSNAIKSFVLQNPNCPQQVINEFLHHTDFLNTKKINDNLDRLFSLSRNPKLSLEILQEIRYHLKGMESIDLIENMNIDLIYCFLVSNENFDDTEKKSVLQKEMLGNDVFVSGANFHYFLRFNKEKSYEKANKMILDSFLETPQRKEKALQACKEQIDEWQEMNPRDFAEWIEELKEGMKIFQ